MREPTTITDVMFQLYNERRWEHLERQIRGARKPVPLTTKQKQAKNRKHRVKKRR